MTYALMLAFFRNDMGFGGNNGLTDFKDILGFNVQRRGPGRAVLRLGVGARARPISSCRFITTSKLGRVLLAMRDAESRVRFLGYSVTATSCSSSRSRPMWPASPARSMCRRSASSTRASSRPATRSRSRSGSRSAAAARWPARSLGAVLVNCAKSWLTGAAPEFWLFLLGALFVLVTLFLPRGSSASSDRAGRRRGAARPSAARSGRAGAGDEPQRPRRCCISTASRSASTGSRR